MLGLMKLIVPMLLPLLGALGAAWPIKTVDVTGGGAACEISIPIQTAWTKTRRYRCSCWINSIVCFTTPVVHRVSRPAGPGADAVDPVGYRMRVTQGQVSGEIAPSFK